MEANLNRWLSYRTVRYAKIENWKIGAIFYALCVVILVYVIYFSIILNKGYQSTDTLVGGTTIKVKGTTSVGNGPLADRVVYDAYDLVMPATEADALFIATSVIHTPNQTRGIWPGADPESEACSSDGDCVAGTLTANGMKLGTCNANGFCDLNTWGPLEDDSSSNALMMEAVKDWTVFVKATIMFPRFDITRNNAKDGLVLGDNLLTVEDMIVRSGYTFDEVKAKGAIILVTIKYDCAVDNGGKDCNPEYLFSRIDVGSSLSPGFNYRYIESGRMPDGTKYRELTKVMGVRFFFQLTGQAGKFDFIALVVTIGSGLAYFGASKLLVDFFLQYFHPSRKAYAQAKHKSVRLKHQHQQEHREQQSQRSFMNSDHQEAEVGGITIEMSAPMHKSVNAIYPNPASSASSSSSSAAAASSSSSPSSSSHPSSNPGAPAQSNSQQPPSHSHSHSNSQAPQPNPDHHSLIVNDVDHQQASHQPVKQQQQSAYHNEDSDDDDDDDSDDEGEGVRHN